MDRMQIGAAERVIFWKLSTERSTNIVTGRNGLLHGKNRADRMSTNRGDAVIKQFRCSPTLCRLSCARVMSELPGLLVAMVLHNLVDLPGQVLVVALLMWVVMPGVMPGTLSRGF